MTGGITSEGLARKVRYIDFDTLTMINREVVSLTAEKHEYTDEDEKRMKRLLKDVEDAATADELDTQVLEKASLLVFRIASGQNFHEGNKRTALVAGLAFLQMNGRTIDMEDRELLSVVDRAGVATADLNDIRDVLGRIIKNV